MTYSASPRSPEGVRCASCPQPEVGVADSAMKRCCPPLPQIPPPTEVGCRFCHASPPRPKSLRQVPRQSARKRLYVTSASLHRGAVAGRVEYAVRSAPESVPEGTSAGRSSLHPKAKFQTASTPFECVCLAPPRHPRETSSCWMLAAPPFPESSCHDWQSPLQGRLHSACAEIRVAWSCPCAPHRSMLREARMASIRR
jgi:hypothetical protein